MKKTAVFARVICLVLMLCMACGAFVGCSDENTNNPQGSTAATTDGGIQLTPPEQVNLGHSIKILYTEEKKNGVVGVEDSLDVVQKATWERWNLVQEKINTEVTWKGLTGVGWGTQTANFAKEVETAQTQTSDPYHAILAYNLYPGMLAGKGLLQNLHNSKYIQADMPWWPQIYIDELTINDAIYGIAENSNKETICNLHGVFFNNTLLEARSLNSPYEMVENNTWTFANMMQLVKDTYSDKNSDGKKDANDFFGVVTGTEAKIETWFFSMGYRYAQKEEDGSITLNLSNTDYMTKWIDEFNAAHTTNDFLIYDTNGHTKAFVEERAILYATSVQLVDSMVANEYDIDYGVVPFPKQNSQQENYISVVANHHVVWCVPIEVNLDESSAILEWMAYEAYNEIAPVYFEQCIKIRYAPDERLAEMYDLIRATLAVDLCQLYTLSYTSGDPRTLITKATNGGQNWVDVWGSVENQFSQEFADILANLYGI